jgi:integrase
MEEPFEPMETASLKSITLKTVFLVALATAQRRSELHALSFEKISLREGGGPTGTCARLLGEKQGA